MPYPAKTSPDAILETALEILERDGPDALSMRNLADALEIKAPSLYRHYADRAALERAIVDAGTRELHERVKQKLDGQTPAAAVQTASNAYLEFARERPHLYDLMLGPCPPDRPPIPTESGKALWNALLAVVGSLTGNPDDTAATVALWAFLHGFVSLERSGQFGPGGPKGGFEVGLTAIIEGLPRTKPRRSR